MRGHIDRVTPEGHVDGWCWNDTAPEETVIVVIAIDGAPIARVAANLFREDLQKEGYGDGRHAFRCILPIGKLESNREHTVVLIDAATGEAIGRPYIYRDQQTLGFDNRLSALEERAALLDGRVNELKSTQIVDVTSAEVFAIIGAFFDRLSRDIARGESVKPERQLADTIKALRKTHPPISFPATQTPLLSIVIEAKQPLGQLYSCLSAVRRATSKIDARVTVLDSGEFEDNALIPSLSYGIQYVRAAGDIVFELADAIRDDNCPFLVFLSGQTCVEETFFDTALEWFDAHPRTAAVGGCATDSDGALRHGGLCLFEGQLEDCGAVGHPDRRVKTAICHPVHALSHQAAVVRRAAFQSANGFDAVFCDDLGAAMVDLCFRMRDAGWAVVSEPRARIDLPPSCFPEWVPPALRRTSSLRDLIVERWMNASDAPIPPLVKGIAAIVGRPDELRDELEAVNRLRDADYLVTYIEEEDHLAEAKVERLRSAGADVETQMPGAGDAFALLFLASGQKSEAANQTRLKHAKLIVGVAELKRLLRTNFSALAVHP